MYKPLIAAVIMLARVNSPMQLVNRVAFQMNSMIASVLLDAIGRSNSRKM